VFPLLILLWRRYPPLMAMGLVVALSLLLLFALALTWVGRLPDYAGTEFAPQYFGLFAMGMFAASVYTAPSPRWNRLRDWCFWEAVSLVCFGMVVLNSAAWPLWKLDLALGAGTIGLLLAASRPGRLNPIHAALSWRPLVWIGGFSYSVYLIHAPLLQVIWQYGLRPLGLGALPTYLALVALGLPLIVAASWGFWYVCERPFLNSKPLGWRASVRTAGKTR
jgi:peptidoglycan/LPS O-acetylase OafA/YrhL